jgi:hypothetical protein
LANLFIDDAALGCPLVYGIKDENGQFLRYANPHVDWIEVRKLLVEKELIKNEII